MEGVGSGEGARRKRSKWDDVDDDEGRKEEHDDDDDVRERQAVAEARAKAAAKAARQRAKAAQRSRQREAQQEVKSATSTPTSSTDAAAAAAGPSSLASASAHVQQQRQGSPHTTIRRQQRQPLPVPPRSWYPPLQGCRSIHHYERLNHIEEGSYGVVFRAREKATGEIVALKKLKMDKEKNGFPITSLREIRTLMEASHENVVRVREIVVGDTLTQIFIVMDFIEHDLKTLLTVQTMPFLASEIKTLLHQLLSAMSLLHRNWIIHRDLKTSNLLMNNRGQLKLADFGLARMYGEPIGETMTQLVVTLWYRAPELLLGATTYDTSIDMWSVGCIFAELMTKEPLFTGKNEIDQITRIFRLLGQPTTDTWPAFNSLPNAKKFTSPSSSSSIVAQPFSTLRQRFKYCTENCLDLLSKLLTYDPAKRITADEALQHPYFRESPAPAHPDSFGSFPSVAAGERKRNSPSAPERLADQKLAYQLEMDL